MSTRFQTENDVWILCDSVMQALSKYVNFTRLLSGSQVSDADYLAAVLPVSLVRSAVIAPSL